MSTRILGFGLGVLLFVAGCGPNWRGINKDDTGRLPPGETAPDAGKLVAYMNDNAHRVTALRCDKVYVDCKQGNQSVGLTGLMACQKPRYFRMKLDLAG
jgi:hypothetical protein